MANGMGNGEAPDLLAALQGPLIPQNPLSQMGAALQGFASGVQGQPNPAFQQADQEQRNRLAVAGVMMAAQRERRLQNQAKLDIARSFPDTTPEARTYKFRTLQKLARDRGMELPDDLITGLIQGEVTPAKLTAAAGEVLRGTPAPEIARLLDIPLLLVQRHEQAFQSNPDLYLDSIGKKTLTQLRKEQTDLQRANLDALRKEQAPELVSPIGPFAIQAHRNTFQKSDGSPLEYWEGTTATKAAAWKAGILDMAKSRGTVTEATVQAQLDAKANAPGSAKDFYNRHSYTPLPASTSQAEAMALAEAGQALKLPKADQLTMPFILQTKGALDAFRDAVRSLPTVFPKATGNSVADMLATGTGWANYQLLLKATDPKTVPVTALQRHLLNIARFSGSGARISNQQALFEKAAAGINTMGTREVKMGLANQLEEAMNTQLRHMGFDPLPPYTPGKVVTQGGRTYRVTPTDVIEITYGN